MNLYMNDIALATFSNFDAGKHASERSQPERFYHGFVLGLLVEVRDLYEVRSNRESGYGRYDVILIPRNLDRDAMILEFKVKETEEKTLQETVQKALAQIEIKKYDAELKERGIPKKKESGIMDLRLKEKGTNWVIENAVNASLEGKRDSVFLLIVIRVPFEAASP